MCTFWDRQELDTTKQLSTHTHIHSTMYTHISKLTVGVGYLWLIYIVISNNTCFTINIGFLNVFT